jgi:hypothetical protein
MLGVSCDETTSIYLNEVIGYDIISVISWLSVLLVEEKTTDLPQITDKLYHIIFYQALLAMAVIRAHNFNGDMH